LIIFRHFVEQSAINLYMISRYCTSFEAEMDCNARQFNSAWEIDKIDYEWPLYM